MSMRSAMLRLCTTSGLVLAAYGGAWAQTAVVEAPPEASYSGPQAQIKALDTSNPATYSNPDFRTSPRGSINDGFSGSSVPPVATAPWTGTENSPPGASGPEEPGALASGSTTGQAAD
jgi:hypothetical protein